MKPPCEPYAAVYASAPWHEKFAAIDQRRRLAAFGFYCACLVYCQTYRTDGHIRREQLVAVFPCRDDQREHLTTLLIQVGLFDESGDGVDVHDYLDWNRSREEIVAGRQGMSEGGRKGGTASGVTRRRRGSKGRLQGSTEKSSEERAVKEKSRAASEPGSSDESDCPECNGTGRAVDNGVCDWCKGTGRV